MEVFGIDVSKYNGNINWAKVAAAGKSFAILKATRKDNKPEEALETNYVGAVTAGIKVGVYKYVYATTEAAAKVEAENIIKAIKGKNITMGVWLDMEDKSLLKLSKSKLSQIIEAEANILQAAGYGIGIYCNKYWYDSVLDSKALSNKYPFWIARYPSNDTGAYASNSSLAPKSYAQAWQYTQKGKVAGISGAVDLDVIYTDLAGLTQSDTTEVLNLMVLSATQRKQLQMILNTLGFKDQEGKELKIDGEVGTRTNYALEEFCKLYLKK